jgi:hypothetical protein
MKTSYSDTPITPIKPENSIKSENDSTLIKMPEQVNYISPKKPERPELDKILYVSESGDKTDSGCISCDELYFPPPTINFPPAKNLNESYTVGVDVCDDYSNEDVIVTNGKIYKTCGKCNKLVRVNKFMIGSLHVCT